MHPLAPSLIDVSEQELYVKYNDLLSRLNQAARFGPHSIIPQIQLMMEHYKSEIAERTVKHQRELAERATTGKDKNGKGFSGVIDIR